MAAQSKIRVLLVDDHQMFRDTMRNLLSGYSDLEVVGEASDGHEAVESVGQLRPAVVLMDINLGKMDGITAARLIRSQYAFWASPSIPETISSMRCRKPAPLKY
jgi:DNA-binding NarL/FixJ family response regulator